MLLIFFAQINRNIAIDIKKTRAFAASSFKSFNHGKFN